MTITKSTWQTVLGVVALLSLSLGTFWALGQFQKSYQSLQKSNEIYQAILEKQSGVIADLQNVNEGLADEIALVKKSLANTELLVAKYEQENAKLLEKVALMDKMSELDETVNRLKEKNALIINQMSQMEVQSPYREKKIKTLKEARKLLKEYKKKIRLTKNRIHELKVEQHEVVVAKLKEADRLASLSGNNGYVIKEGKPVLLEAARKVDQKVRINVEFVK
jgi:chromosome segregation ATPase